MASMPGSVAVPAERVQMAEMKHELSVTRAAAKTAIEKGTDGFGLDASLFSSG